MWGCGSINTDLCVFVENDGVQWISIMQLKFIFRVEKSLFSKTCGLITSEAELDKFIIEIICNAVTI